MIRKVVIFILLFAALATSVAWVSIPSAPEGFLRHLSATRESKLQFAAYQGDAVLCYGNFPDHRFLPPLTIYQDGFDWGVLSLHLLETRPPSPLHGWCVSMPFPVAVLLLIAYPIIAFIRGPLRRRRRRRHGLCAHCGYNLEGNVSGVCPECGEAL